MNAFEEVEYHKKFDLGIWKSLGRFMKPYRMWLLGLFFTMVGVAGIDAVFPVLNRYAIDNFIVPRTLEGIVPFAAVYVGVILVQVVNVVLLILIAGKIEMGICYDIRKAGFKKLQELSLSYYDRTPVGWMMSRMTSDVHKVGSIISWGLVDLVWGGGMIIFIMIFMFVMNVKLALIALAVFPVLVGISVFFQQIILKQYREVKKNNSKITGAFNEGIMGAKTTKTLVCEDENRGEFNVTLGKMYRSSVKSIVFSSIYLPCILFLGSIATGLVIWRGGFDVINDVLSYGTLVAFISYTILLFEPIRELARILGEFQSAQASAERIISLVETEPEITDSAEVIKTYGNIERSQWPKLKGDITFEQVDFKYKEGQPVLTNFNLEVKAGQTIALVGETGSGKSTIVNLACRFYEPTSGVIKVDGVNYRERPLEWLHSSLGYVLQSPHLFSGTIRDNIRYGRLDATDEEVERVAKIVNAHSFIVNLENGYDTEVGEGGSRLSTGEKQLLSFARAIIADPAILVLDEATSSIDTETEQRIQGAIDKLLEGRTSFIVAHRLSTIRSADRILVIKEGRILESGNHHELLARRGYYYKLYTTQFVEEQEELLLKA